MKQAAQQALSIRVLIGGTMLDPRVTLESDAQPPISQSDLLSYLAFGSESGSLLQFGGSSVSGGTSGGGLVGTSAALATRQLASVALGVAVKESKARCRAHLAQTSSTSRLAECADSKSRAATSVRSGRFLAARRSSSASTSDAGRSSALRRSSVPCLAFASSIDSVGRPGLSIESTLQPRFFLPEPSLSVQDLRKANALGFFLTRIWRF